MLEVRGMGRGDGESAKQALASGGAGTGVAVSQPHSGGTGGVTVGTDKGCGAAGNREQFGP
jgi:hypothetical protein